MNPRATPWTPSTPRVRFPAFSSAGAPHEHGTPSTPRVRFPRVQLGRSATRARDAAPGPAADAAPGVAAPRRGSPRVKPYGRTASLVSRRAGETRRRRARRVRRPPSPLAARTNIGATPRLPRPAAAPSADARTRALRRRTTRGAERGARPRNDYSLHFVATGERPQNFILDGASSASARLERFPTRRELAALKRARVARHAQPAMWLHQTRRVRAEPASFGNVLT